MGALRTHNIPFLSEASYTGAAASSHYPVGEYKEMTLFVVVTTITEGQTLDLKLQISPDAEHWSDSTAFGQITATGTKHISFAANIAKYARVYYTPSAATTFSVIGVVKA